MFGYEESARLASEASRDDADTPRGGCDRCGAPTGGNVCRKCGLVDELGGELPGDRW